MVTLSKLVTPSAMHQCLQFAYTGTIDRSALNLQETREAAEFLELPQLLILLTKHPFVGPDHVDKTYENLLKRRLQDICFDQGLFADVIFELDDGACAAHRAMLTARCDVMKAMFSGDFRESQAKVVSLTIEKQVENLFPRLNFQVYASIHFTNCFVLYTLMKFQPFLPYVVSIYSN